MKKSTIYLFYEIVANGANRTSEDDGNVHYHCFHGAHKICTIKKSMRSNLNGAFSFFAALFFSQNVFSSCEQSACPHQADVSTILCSQRPWWAPDAWWNRYHIWEVTIRWEGRSWILEEAQQFVGEYQESVSRPASLCYCKWNRSDLSIVCNLWFYNRGHGTRRNSSKYLWNGSSHVTNPSKK